MTWSLMDSAPTQYAILIFDPSSGVRVAESIAGIWYSIPDDDNTLLPTHWMYLPDDPE